MKNTVSMMSALLLSLASIAPGTAKAGLPQQNLVKTAELPSADKKASDAELIAQTLKKQIANEVIFESFDNVTNSWVNSSKFVFKKDENGNVLSQVELTWATNEWKFDSKKAFNYDKAGNCNSETFYKWDVNSLSWIPVNKVERQFSVNNTESKRSNFVWNESSSSFDLDNHTYFEYDSQNKLSSFLHKPQNTDFLKKEFIFDENGQIAGSVIFSWNSSAKKWNYLSKEVVTYHSVKPIKTTRAYTWNLETQDWESNSTLRETFNKKGNPKSIELSNQNNTNVVKERFMYGANGMLCSKTTGMFDKNANNWLDYTIEAYSYDEAGRILSQNDYLRSENQQGLTPITRVKNIFS